jgi:hypothetical protein
MTNRLMAGRSLLLIALLCGLAVLPVCEAQQGQRFFGTVVDEQGAGISHAEIGSGAGALAQMEAVSASRANRVRRLLSGSALLHLIPLLLRFPPTRPRTSF